MKNEFKVGILKALAFYIIGFIIAAMTYFVFGWDYKHASGLHHIVAFSVVLTGFIWLLVGLLSFLKNTKLKSSLGASIMNAIVIGSCIVYFTSEINQGTTTTSVPKIEGNVTFSIDNKSNSFIGINGLGDTVYKKIGDTVLIDRMDKGSNAE